MAEMIWDVPLQVIYTTSGAKLWRGQPDVKGSLVGTVKPEWAAFIKRAVNCHAELLAALEPFGYDDPQGDCFSDDAPVEIRCEGYVLLTATAGDLRQAAAALAKAKEPTSDESRLQQQDLDEETL